MKESNQINTSTKTPRNSGFDYVPEIDGLRAISVLAVLLYHFGFSVCPGGFAGVDVFFVISGFLIGKKVFGEIENQHFSLKKYYLRRFRRILPALLAMLAVVLLSGFFVMTPFELISLASSASHAACGLANIHFGRVAENYFAGNVDQMPLLHTWSLGVEEQFYLFLPLILLSTRRIATNRGHIRLLLATLIIVSLVWSQTQINSNPDRAFYGIFSRAWELLVGVILSCYDFPESRGVKSIIATVGIGLILGAFASFDKFTPFPGMAAALPVLGAACVIIGGDLGPGGLLTVDPLRGVGKISYSLYLWHWPVLVLFNSVHSVATWWSKAFLLTLTFCVSFCSWKYVEQPFRRYSGKPLRNLVFASVAVIALLAFGSRYLRKNNGFLVPPSEEIRSILAAGRESNPSQRKAFDKHVPPESAYVYGDKSVPPSYVLWGDSHANAIAYGLGEVAARHSASVKFYGRGGAKPVPALYTNAKRADKARKQYVDASYGYIKADPTIHTVILCARWITTIRKETVRPTADASTRFQSSPGAYASSEAALADGLGSLVRDLNNLGKRVVLFYPIPEYGVSVPQLVATATLNPRKALAVPTLADFLEVQKPIFQIFDNLGTHSGLLRLKPHNYLANGDQLLYSDGKHPLYQDDNHLNLSGAKRLTPLFEEIFLPPPAAGH
jgi:peptidoglycan/LPS O-acetylase OafA/YrhL